MKINFIVQGYYPAIGGSEFLLQNLAETLSCKYDHICKVFTTNTYSCDAFNDPELPRMNIGKKNINGVEIYRYNISGKYGTIFKKFEEMCSNNNLRVTDFVRMLHSGPRSFDLYWSLLNEKCDLIFASSFPLMHILVSYWITKFCGRKIIIQGNFHIDDCFFDNELNRKIVKNCDGYICNTKVEYDYFIKNGVSSEKLEIIPPAIVSIKNNLDLKIKPRELLKLPDKTIILYFGQLLKNKNIDMLLDGFCEIAEKNKDICIVFGGSGYSKYYIELKKKVMEFNSDISERIYFFLNVDEITKDLIYRCADIFVFPSLFESFGISLIEAWSYKLPVIASDLEQIKDTVKDKFTGLIFNRYNKNDLIDKMQILIMNSDIRETLRENGYNEFLKKFEKEKLGEKTEKFLNKIMCQ
ncbi:glycosyltransferase family 4 protein [Candidatus Dependentiae bacterium]|nr:glycosyltransferase family 4 protein [Candidatus Dependentiae bacterium]